MNLPENVKKFEYIGWSKTESGKHYDTDFFLYYKINIYGKTYYANVKASNRGSVPKTCVSTNGLTVKKQKSTL